MKNLTQSELKLAAKLLEVAAERFRNQVFDDFDLTFLSLEERREIIRNFQDWNGSPEDYDENDVDAYADHALMDYLSSRLT